MSNFLFNEFKGTTPEAWKQKIQAELKGADYNQTLLWKTNEGIVVKPFYTKEDRNNLAVNLPKENFFTCQTIFIGDEKKANSIAINAINRGANAIQFTANKTFNYQLLLKNLDILKSTIYFSFSFLNEEFIVEISKYLNSKNCFFQTDIIGNLAKTGNWHVNLKEDFKKLETIVASSENCIAVSGDMYQNAGANMVQQLAYMLAHANEYINRFNDIIVSKIHFKFAVGSNYFLEIAKLRAFRVLWSSLLENYQIPNVPAHIFTQPTLRNKTLYDYNVNMLRTTSEYMSAILGGSNTVSTISYDAIYHKSNEFGERIARNQLLILQEESGFIEAQNFVNGAYYIESLTEQLAEKALVIFKEIEKNGGLLQQLRDGTIQKKIKESALKEDSQLKENTICLLGTNLQPNKKDTMKHNLELYPFVKQRNIKTIITPIIQKRISEDIEQDRLKQENA